MSIILTPADHDNCRCTNPTMFSLSKAWSSITRNGNEVRAIACLDCHRAILASDSRHPDHAHHLADRSH